MRLILTLTFVSLVIIGVDGQSKKPEITGQRELFTNAGQPITLQLTDLYVEETADNTDGSAGGNNDNPGDNSGGVDDVDDGHGGNNGGDGKGGDKGEKDKDKGKDKDKDKDKDKGKGHGGNDRTLAYPQGYTLEVFTGKNYSVSGTTVTPDPAFTGILTVEVRVRNDRHASKKYDLKITVNPVNNPPQNKAPVITGQLPLNTPKDSPLKVKLSDLQVTDPDDEYPSGFSLQLMPGDKYAVDEMTITPQSGFTGELIVPVTVNDGTNESKPFNLKIDVLENPNVTPQITGQIPLSISRNQSVKVVPAYLLVSDPDNSYPVDFTLNIFEGENYTLQGSTVQPDHDFTGDILVKVSVHDGKASSNVFELKISVTPAANVKPVISGQTGIKLPEGQSLEIKLSHLVVEDPDNRYPQDFTLLVLPGNDYTVSNNTITPVNGFLGTMAVKVSVNDGQISSEPFDLHVEVVAPDRLEIVGQKFLEIAEDSAIVVRLSDLSVNDPGNTSSDGLTLQVLSGENYDVTANAIRPHRDFYGNLTVPVTVRRNETTSAPFSLLVVVAPVNDPPVLLNVETDPVLATGSAPWNITATLEVADVDDDHVLFAEVGFRQGSYESGKDQLLIDTHENIRGVFDTQSGVLFLVGRAPLADYQSLLRSLKYSNKRSADSIDLTGPKTVYLRLNDGKDTGPEAERALLFDTRVALEIPSAFTPNNDHANDTWKITPVKQAESIKAFIRVYDKRGNMVFETSGLENEWDGILNGTPLPADIYFYTIEMDLSYRKVNYKGVVAILR
jgi:gliding motility-associated-like protein